MRAAQHSNTLADNINTNYQYKYSLADDSIKPIMTNLNNLLDSCIQEGTILKSERFLLTTKIEKRAQFHSHEIVVTKPHTYLLFKGHKSKKEDFRNQVISPASRMLTDRLGLLLIHIMSYFKFNDPVLSYYAHSHIWKISRTI